MKKTDVQKIIYRIRHRYLTFNNMVIFVAFLVALGWLWGSLQVMQRNYVLQREVDHKRRELAVTRLQKDNLELQKRYYQTNEYKEMAARESLGLVMPGERVLILPANTEAVKQSDKEEQRTPGVAVAVSGQEAGNFEQWMNFLFGGYSKSMQGLDDADQ